MYPAPAIPAKNSGDVDSGFDSVVTSAPGAYWKTDEQLTQAAASATADVTVDDATASQTWEGFGGAFNELGWSYLSLLDQADRDKALNLLYGADGARFAFELPLAGRENR